MEGCASKRLSLDINTVGFYDEAEEMEKMMNSLKEEGEMLGEKRGIKKGAKEERNLLQRIFLKMDCLFLKYVNIQAFQKIK